MVATASVLQEEAEAAEAPRRLRYIPALDGLRAVAVVGVMLFHGGVSWMPGGFLGVDVFFVLSGYLITTLLLRERLATGRIALRSFWIRRLRRLLPALLVLLGGVAVATPFLVEPHLRASLRGDALAALAYVANWRFVFTEQSYFAGTPSPLRHLWSLAVEEQWYVVFPVVVALALRRARRITPLLAGLVVATAASALWMAHLTSGALDPSRAYYGTDARAHSLLAGAVLAVVAAQWSLHRFRWTLTVVGLLGMAGVVGAYLFVHESDAWMYQGGFLALALASAALVAGIALRSDTPLGRVLAMGPLVAIGRVSYGLYLWHWPVNVALTPRRTGLDGSGWWEEPALLALRTAVAVAFTLASYFLVEVPVRRRGIDGLRLRLPGLRRSRPAAVAMCTGLVVWLLVAATLRIPVTSKGILDQAGGLPPDMVEHLESEPEEVEEPPVTVPVEIREAVERDGIPAVPPDRPVRIMMVGDSVPMTLVWRTPEVPPEIEMDSAARLGCSLVPGFVLVDGSIDRSALWCEEMFESWQEVAQRSQPDVVVVHFGAWEVYDHKVGQDIVEFGTPEMEQMMRERLDQGFRAITAIKPDVRFLFVGMPCMAEENLQLGGATSPRNEPDRVDWVNRIFEEYSDDLGPRSRYADLGELFCDGDEAVNVIDGQLVRDDGVHYAMGAGGPVWRWIADQSVPLARTPVAPLDGEGGPDTGVAGGTNSTGPADPSEAGASDPPA